MTTLVSLQWAGQAPILRGMDGIAAIEARVAEICRRFAPPPPVAPSGGDTFATHLRSALGAGGPSGADEWIAEAIARTGAPASWAPALRTIAAHESSLDPGAANVAASGGKAATTPLGLMQMLPSTFAAHAQPGHGNIFDPVDNMSAAIDYIRARYGDPASTPGLRALARGDHYAGY